MLWVRPFTCISDIYSKFVLLTLRSSRITVKSSLRVDLFLREENGPESKREKVVLRLTGCKI